MANWDLSQMPEQTGKIVIVTGATNGIGYEMTKVFAQKNATVILAVRNTKLGDERVREIRQTTQAGQLVVMPLDLGDLATVRQFATAFKAKYTQLHVLMNNAGVMAIPYATTKDGFEMQIGVNYLGHFVLTGLLLDVIKATPNSRVVTLSSSAEVLGNIKNLLADFDQKKNYARWIAYGHSKLAQLMFAYELNRRFVQHGYSARAVGVNPGNARTNLRAHGMADKDNLAQRLSFNFFELMSQSQEMGVLPPLYAATSPEVQGGDFVTTRWLNFWGYPARKKSSKQAYDTTLARQLWDKSEAVTGFKYTF